MVTDRIELADIARQRRLYRGRGTLPLSKPALIAIVDDDQAVRDALAELLQVEGVSTQTFASADAFLAASEFRAFAGLITDVGMPDTDGLELQRELRARSLATPVIFVTASTDGAARDLALRAGALGWFAKPVTATPLMRLVRALLERPPESGT